MQLHGGILLQSQQKNMKIISDKLGMEKLNEMKLE